MIDPGSVVPLYHQIKQNIHDLIENEVLNDGDLLPSKRQLGEIYGVNRLTVRQALNDLVNEGMLQRQRGIGTFVAVPKLTQVFDRVLGFSDSILEAGHKSANIAGPDEMQSVYALQRAGQRLPTRSGSSENDDGI